MELQEFIKSFASQFEETDPKLITKTTVFKETEEWSSLISLSVIAMIDEEYDIQLNGNDIRSAITVEDLFNLVKSKQK